MKHTILILVAALLFATGFWGGSVLRGGLLVQEDYRESIGAAYDDDIILAHLMLDLIQSPDRFEENVEDIKGYMLVSSYRLMQRPGYEGNSGAKSFISSFQDVPEATSETKGECTNRSVFEVVVNFNEQHENVENALSNCRLRENRVGME